MTLATTACVGLDRLAVGEPHADGAARADEHALDVAVGLADSAVVANQLHERLGELRAAAARNRHPALLHRDRDHLRHEAGRRLIRPETGVQHPRRQHAVRTLRRERRLEPVAARLQHFAREGDGARAAEPPHGLRPEREPRRRPQLGAEDAEGEIGVGEEALEHPRPLRSELLRVALRRPQEKRRASIRERGRRGQLGVEVLEPARRELVAELGVRGAADPERMPRAVDVVQEPRLGQLLGLDRAAEPVVPLEHADAPLRPREQRGARE